MDGETEQRRYSFVTVCFEDDAGLLQLQARSIRRYCPADLIDEIIVVDNSLHRGKYWLNRVLPQYGNLSGLVKILPASQIADIPVATDGWLTQQILKIKVAASVRADRFVLLDSKDHLIRNLEREFLETPFGRPRTNGYSYINQPMRPFLERTLEYLGLDAQTHLDWFTRTTTPFTMLTDQALELLSFVEKREGRQFSVAFLDKGLSEFFLYSGYLISKGKLCELYDITQPNGPTVWVDKADEKGCSEVVQKAGRAKSPFMAVHRKAIARMEPPARKVLADFWHGRDLFASERDGVRFLLDPNRCRQGVDGRVYRPSVGQSVGRFVSRLARMWTAK